MGNLKKSLNAINESLREYFDVRRQRSELTLKLQKKQSKLADKFNAKDKPLAEREAELAKTIRELIIPKKLELIAGQRRSFSTIHGNVFFRKKPETTKLTDVAGFKRRARLDRKLTTLGSFTRTWKPKPISDIQKWLNQNPDLAARYVPFIGTEGGYDELLVQPNDAYLTEYDPNRLTEKKTNLGRADDPVVEEDDTNPSPDA